MPREWQNLFAIIRFHYKEVLFDIFYYYWDKQNRFFYWGLRYIEVHYTEAPLYFKMLCFSPILRMEHVAYGSALMCSTEWASPVMVFSLKLRKNFIMYTYSLSNTKQSTPPLPAMQLAVRKSSLPNKTNKIVVKGKMLIKSFYTLLVSGYMYFVDMTYSVVITELPADTNEISEVTENFPVSCLLQASLLMKGAPLYM